MLGEKFVINPWKLAFYFIFVANVVFHSSPSFLLLVLLFTIFAYAYIYLSTIFFNHAAQTASQVERLLGTRYDYISNKLSKLSLVFINLRGMTNFFSLFLKIWGGKFLAYRCDNFPLSRVFVLLTLSEYFLEEDKILQEGLLDFDFQNIANKSKFLGDILNNN